MQIASKIKYSLKPNILEITILPYTSIGEFRFNWKSFYFKSLIVFFFFNHLEIFMEMGVVLE